jgi:putative membrane protein
MQAIINKNDRRARFWIILVSVIIFAAVVLLDSKVLKIPYPFSFDVHQFALANAIINSLVSLWLIIALVAIKQKNINLHKNVVLLAIILSVLFLVSYICHHLWAGDTKYGGAGVIKLVYYFILITHIILAAVILPFILFTAYRGLTGESDRHRKIAKYTWPLWFYVSVTGVVVYLMISPYYS